MKRFIILLVAAVVLGGSIGSAFIGGITIGKSQGREEVTLELQNRTSQFASRFGQDGTQSGADDQQSGLTPPAGIGIPFGRGSTMGMVEKIEGGIITVTTPTGTVNVITSSGTTVQKMGNGSLIDIKTGDTISVSGESKDDGTIQATSIFITPNMSASK
jgi:hypothetical protein